MKQESFYVTFLFCSTSCPEDSSRNSNPDIRTPKRQHFFPCSQIDCKNRQISKKSCGWVQRLMGRLGSVLLGLTAHLYYSCCFFMCLESLSADLFILHQCLHPSLPDLMSFLLAVQKTVLPQDPGFMSPFSVFLWPLWFHMTS